MCPTLTFATVSKSKISTALVVVSYRCLRTVNSSPIVTEACQIEILPRRQWRRWLIVSIMRQTHVTLTHEWEGEIMVKSSVTGMSVEVKMGADFIVDVIQVRSIFLSF